MTVYNYYTYPRPALGPDNWSDYHTNTILSSKSYGANGITVNGTNTLTGTKTFGIDGPRIPVTDAVYLSFDWIISTRSSSSLKYQVSWYNSSDGAIAATSLTSAIGSSGTSGRYMSALLTPPAGTVRASLRFEFTTTGTGSSYSFSIDKIRLASQNNAAYIDGATPGYTWTGTAYQSVTIDLPQLSATGVSLSGGSALLATVPSLSATAAGSSTGSIESYLAGLSASGTANSAGSAAVWPYGPITATAQGASNGTVQVYAIVNISADGTGTGGGIAHADLTLPTFATASSISTGRLTLGLPPEFSAVADGTTIGSLQVAVAGMLVARGTADSSGSLAMGQAIPVGAFADFAVFGVTETDPLMSVVGANNGGTATGANVAEWTRIWSEFTAPDEVVTSQGTLWQRAAYCVPGIRFDSVAAGNWQEFTRVQVEYSQPGGPTDYRYAAALRPLVYPDRANLWVNTIVVNTDPGPSYTPVAETSLIPGDSAPALRIDLLAGHSTTVTCENPRLKPGAYYTLSAYVKIAGAVFDAGFTVTGTDGAVLADTVRSSDGEIADFDSNWRRIAAVFQAPEDGTCRITWDYLMGQNSGTESFRIAGILLEEGIEVRPYFSFKEGDLDYWHYYYDESGNPASGAFYYKDYARRDYILRQALNESAPSGVLVENPEYAKIPHLDN